MKLIAGALVASAIELRLCGEPEVINDAALPEPKWDPVAYVGEYQWVNHMWEERLRDAGVTLLPPTTYRINEP